MVLDHRFSQFQVQHFVVEFLLSLSTKICLALFDLYTGLNG